jgi:hypothetical protein
VVVNVVISYPIRITAVSVVPAGYLLLAVTDMRLRTATTE